MFDDFIAGLQYEDLGEYDVDWQYDTDADDEETKNEE